MRKLMLAFIITASTAFAVPAMAQGAHRSDVLPPCCGVHQPMQDTPTAATRLNMAALYRDVRAADSRAQATGQRIKMTGAQAAGICRQFRSAVYLKQGFDPMRQVAAMAYAIAYLGPQGIFFAPILTRQFEVKDPQDHAILGRCRDIRRSSAGEVTMY